MRKKVVSSKRLALAAFTFLLLSAGTLFGQHVDDRTKLAPQVTDQRILMSDEHQHTWDDLRLLLVTITEINGDEVRWKHSTPFETKTGVWHVGKMLSQSDKGIHSDRVHPGKEFVAVYCIECQTVIWLYEGR